jgi:hypothetical protein
MTSIVTSSPRSRLLELPETATATAKADLRKPKTFIDYREKLAREVVEPVLRGLTLDEVSGLILEATGRDINTRQIARWKTGEERPQFDAIVAVERFRHPLLIAWAQFIGAGVEMETVIKIRRVA